MAKGGVLGAQSRIAQCTVAVRVGHALLRLAARSPDSPFYRSLTAGDMAAILAPVAWLINEEQIQGSAVPR